MDAKQKYLDEIRELDESYLEEKRRILLEYARQHCPYKRGDQVRDATWWIEIQKVLVTYRRKNLPQIELHGVCLTKSKKPCSNGATRTILLDEIIQK